MYIWISLPWRNLRISALDRLNWRCAYLQLLTVIYFAFRLCKKKYRLFVQVVTTTTFHMRKCGALLKDTSKMKPSRSGRQLLISHLRVASAARLKVCNKQPMMQSTSQFISQSDGFRVSPSNIFYQNTQVVNIIYAGWFVYTFLWKIIGGFIKFYK